MLTLNLVIPSTSRADPKDDLLAACDTVATSCAAANLDLRLVSTKQKELIEVQAKELEHTRSQRDSFLHNDTLWFVLGAITIGFVGNAFNR